MKLTGHEAIEYAEANGLDLNMYSNPIEDARIFRAADCDGIGDTIHHAEARKVASEDPSLIWLESEATHGPRN